MFKTVMSLKFTFMLILVIALANMILAANSRFRPLNSTACKEVQTCKFTSLPDLFLYYHNNKEGLYNPGADLDEQLLICLFGYMNCPYMRNDFEEVEGKVLEDTLEPNAGVQLGLGVDLSRMTNEYVFRLYGYDMSVKAPFLKPFYNDLASVSITNVTKIEQTFNDIISKNGTNAFVFDDALLKDMVKGVSAYFYNDLKTAYETVVRGVVTKKLSDLPTALRTVLFALNYNIGIRNMKLMFPDMWQKIDAQDWMGLAAYIESTTNYPQSQWQRTIYFNILIAQAYLKGENNINEDSFSDRNVLYLVDAAPFAVPYNNNTAPCNGNATDSSSPFVHCQYLNLLQSDVAKSIDQLIFERTDIRKVVISAFCGGYSTVLGVPDVNTTAASLMAKVFDRVTDLQNGCINTPYATDSVLQGLKYATDPMNFNSNAVIVIPTAFTVDHSIKSIRSAIDGYKQMGVKVITQALLSPTGMVSNFKDWLAFLSYTSGQTNVIFFDITTYNKVPLNNYISSDNIRLLSNKAVTVASDNTLFSVRRTKGNFGSLTFQFNETSFNTSEIEAYVSTWNPIPDSTFLIPTPFPTAKTNITIAPAKYFTNTAYTYDDQSVPEDFDYVYFRVVNRGVAPAKYDVYFSECATQADCAAYTPPSPYAHTTTYTAEGEIPVAGLFPEYSQYVPEPADTVGAFGTATAFVIILLVTVASLLASVALFIRCKQVSLENERNSETILRKI